MIPQTLIIQGRTYKIVRCELLSDVCSAADAEGILIHDQLEIRIHAPHGSDPVRAWHILIHEILEAFVAVANIRSLSGEKRHDDLDRVAGMMADTFIRNGLLKGVEDV
jgi:hypothetical protein